MDTKKTVMKWSVLLCVVCLIMVGCGSILKQTPPATEEGQVGEPPASGKVEPSPKYYDFDDVLVPAELKLNAQQTMVVSTSTFSGGVLVFDGNVEPSSLIDFFMANMAKDNWQLKSSVKSAHAVMTFEKPHKACVITVGTGAFNTPVEIWVGAMHEPMTGQVSTPQPRP